VVEKDKDGIEIYSKTVTLKPVDVVDFLKVYPNPASTQVYIESNEMIAGITVYDMLGRVQFQKTYNNKKISINTSGLSNGAYELIITNEAGKIYSQRLVVQ
jgi:hypothetical protein